MRECFDVPRSPVVYSYQSQSVPEFEVGFQCQEDWIALLAISWRKERGRKVIPVYFDFGQEYREKEPKARKNRITLNT